MEVDRIWGGKSPKIDFHPTVNVIIGPNGSGKTTVINLIRHVLNADIVGLSHIAFDEVRLSLVSFGGESKRTIVVTTKEDGYVFKVSRKTYEIQAEFLAERFVHTRHRVRLQMANLELVHALKDLVPGVWLPVSRRLPVPEEEDIWRERTAHRGKRLESVDERLFELIQSLGSYRSSLDTQLSRRYKQFERDVLSVILWSKEYDFRTALDQMPTEDEKHQLTKAFEEAGLLDSIMRKRIDEHFIAAANAVERGFGSGITTDQLMVVPLIPRTRRMVEFAVRLENQRTEIFAPLRRFEKIANGFLNNKILSVSDTGQVQIRRQGGDKKDLSIEQLSSGEKQILILLIEALLREGNPVVYVADEPELSLHIEWQEKLLSSLVDLAREVQIIVATHSPDIVGPYHDNVINLGLDD